jgi:hypothetical protein
MLPGDSPQFGGAVQLPKLSARDALDCLKAPARLPMVKSLSFRATERLGHTLFWPAFNVKR